MNRLHSDNRNSACAPRRSNCRRQHLSVVLLVLLLSPVALQAQAVGELGAIEQRIDQVHKDASELLNGFASQIDNYFSDGLVDNKINNTSATLRFDFSDPDDGDFSANAKIKLRLVLPRSEKRIRLLFDVDEEDAEDDTRRFTITDEEQDVSLALRFVRQAQEHLSFNVDVGARRFEQRFQSFARLRLASTREKENNWSYKLSNDLRQYYSSGYVNQLRLDFWRRTKPGSSTVFRTSSSSRWQRNEPGARIDQTVGVYRELNQRSLLAFEMLAGYNTSPEEGRAHYEGHRARIRYRRNAFRPWMYFEIWPSISWLTENNNRTKLGLLMRTEFRFGQR